MEISEITLFYQLVIFSIIVLCSLWHKYAFWIAVGLACLWTSTHVLAPWLAILQYGTIMVATIIGLSILATKNMLLSIIHGPDRNRRIRLPIILVIVGGIIDYLLLNTDLFYDVPIFISFIPCMVLLSAIVVQANILGSVAIGALGSLAMSVLFQGLAPIGTWTSLIVGTIIVSLLYRNLTIKNDVIRILLAVIISQLVTTTIAWTFANIWELGFTYILQEAILPTLVTIIVTYLIIQIGYWLLTKRQANN